MREIEFDDDRIPGCPACDTHPMHIRFEHWYCPNCSHQLDPQLTDPLWPWESAEEAHERRMKNRESRN